MDGLSFLEHGQGDMPKPNLEDSFHKPWPHEIDNRMLNFIYSQS